MDMHLNQIQLRVLGALIEKEITTPENYPLSLNALLNACNQRSSRSPVLDLDEEQIRQALPRPRRARRHLSLSRRPRHQVRAPHPHRTQPSPRRNRSPLSPPPPRPSNPGELRSRADFMSRSFDDLASVTAALDRLAARPLPTQKTLQPLAPSLLSSPASPEPARPVTLTSLATFQHNPHPRNRRNPSAPYQSSSITPHAQLDSRNHPAPSCGAVARTSHHTT